MRAEGREGGARHARYITHAARHARSFDCDIGKLGCGRHFMDGGIGDKHGAPTAERDGNTNHTMTRLGIDDAAHVVETCRIIAGHARHHAIGIAQRHHACRKMIAVIVDEAVAIARQVALALQLLIEIVGVGRIAARQARIDDFDARTVEVETGSLRVPPE